MRSRGTHTPPRYMPGAVAACYIHVHAASLKEVASSALGRVCSYQGCLPRRASAVAACLLTSRWHGALQIPSSLQCSSMQPFTDCDAVPSHAAPGKGQAALLPPEPGAAWVVCDAAHARRRHAGAQLLAFAQAALARGRARGRLSAAQEQVQQEAHRRQVDHDQDGYQGSHAMQRVGRVLVLHQVKAAVQQLLVRMAGVVLNKGYHRARGGIPVGASGLLSPLCGSRGDHSLLQLLGCLVLWLGSRWCLSAWCGWGCLAGSVGGNLLPRAVVVASKQVDPHKQGHDVYGNQEGHNGAIAQEDVLVSRLHAALDMRAAL